jgi:hypothetical protein
VWDITIWSTKVSSANLAITYGDLGRYAEAEVLELEVWRQRKQHLGIDHPDTIDASASLAVTYGQLGRYADAEVLELEVIDRTPHWIIRCRRYFPDTDTATEANSGLSANCLAAPPSAYRPTGRGGTVLVQIHNSKKATVLRTSTDMAADVDEDDLGEMMAWLRALRA